MFVFSVLQTDAHQDVLVCRSWRLTALRGLQHVNYLSWNHVRIFIIVCLASAPGVTSFSYCSSVSSMVCQRHDFTWQILTFTIVQVDGIDDKAHPFKSLILGQRGPYIPYPSHSFLSYFGPNCSILMLDCRYCSFEIITKGSLLKYSQGGKAKRSSL